MTPRVKRLKAYRLAATGVPVIGVDDCGPWVVKWVEMESGVRLALPRYSTPKEGYALAAAAGGFVAYAVSLFAGTGIFETGIPVLGDACVVRLRDRDTAAIYCESGSVMIRNETGGAIILPTRHILKAWSIPETAGEARHG